MKLFNKALLAIAFLATATSAFAKSEIVCMGVELDIVRSATPDSTELKREEDQFFISYSGALNGNSLRLNIEKSSMTAHGFIDAEGGVSHTFTGAFAKNGRLEFSSMSGGNIMMPAKLVAISCARK